MKTVLTLIIALFSCCVLRPAASAAERPPNIVFILADDIGLNGIGCYGADRFQGRTPNIDALAANGVRFEQGYSMPTCNPSRCVLMTGRYTFRYGNKPSFKNEPSVANVLKQAGYATGMAGKWRQMADTPRDWGFDEYLTDPEASGYYWEKTYTKNGETVTTPEPVYYPDVCLEFARDFFKQHRDQPFFFYYPTHLIHNRIVRTPDSKPDTTDAETLYADMVAYLDQHVGQLAASLESLGLREQTIIVFAGDNGTMRKFGGNNMTIGGRQILGEKATMLEGGSRVPLIA
jgi:arylsulfatase A